MGISPIYILFAVYAGVKLFGVGGIVKGPLALIVICEILKKREKSEQKIDEPSECAVR